jgi:hypothetical protein
MNRTSRENDGALGRRVVRVFVPRKFHATAVARIGGDLWGYLCGGREQADYYLGADGTPTAAAAELHGQLWARLGLEGLDRIAFERLAAGVHPVTGERLVKTSHVTRVDPATGGTVAHGGMHVPGIDCNLSPPKSVSALLVDAHVIRLWLTSRDGNDPERGGRSSICSASRSCWQHREPAAAPSPSRSRDVHQSP